MHHDFEGLADEVDFAGGEVVVEWECEGSAGDAFADGVHAFVVAELLAVEGLEVDGWEVVADADVVAADAFDDGVAVFGGVFGTEQDDEDEPAHGGGRVDGGELDVAVAAEPFEITGCYVVAFLDDFGKAAHLGYA